MKLSDLFKYERKLKHLSYSYEILEFNRKHSFFHEFDDIPFPHVRMIAINHSNVSQKVDGRYCSWRNIFKIADSLIPKLQNPNEIYLEDINVEGTTLYISLGS